MKWHKTQYTGVVYRQNEKRKYQGRPDRYFIIRYKLNGKLKNEPVGWSSDGATAVFASRIRGKLIQNILLGQHPQTLKEKREMEQAHREAEIARQEAENLNRLTFDAVARKYIGWSKQNKKSWKDDAIRYGKHLRPILSELTLKEITVRHLDKIKNQLTDKGLAPATIKHCLALVRQIFNKARAWNLYDGSNPVEGFRLPKLNNRRIRFLTHEEADILLKEIQVRSPMLHDQALLSIHTGMRFGEIAAMKWNDIDFENGIIHILSPKSGESRQVYITDEVKAMLEERKMQAGDDASNLVFPDRHGKIQKSVSDTFDRVINDLGWNENTAQLQKVVFHTLRHTFASWLAIQGTPLYTIKELMGHKSIVMTERYAHLIPGQKIEAVKLLAEKFSSDRKKD
ncbi:MAG TPA: site-specific integrase [Desulfobacteraceae bacterium]|nr:site-specific integrase [Desulfobacteraceae bacterium]